MKKKKIHIFPIYLRQLYNKYVNSTTIPIVCLYQTYKSQYIKKLGTIFFFFFLYFFIFLSERLVLISKCEYKSTILLLMFFFIIFRCMSLNLSGVDLARYDIRSLITFIQCQMFIAAFCKNHVFF